VTNKDIINAIRTTAALLELHEESSLKIRSYQNAVFNLEKSSKDLTQLPFSELCNIKGVGKSIAENITEIQKNGSFDVLTDLLGKTPPGILELMGIKGLGAKKIRQLWKELCIENKEQLIEAVNNDKLVNLKGFGKKTQDNIKKSLTEEEANKGKLMYSQAEAFTAELLELIQKQLPQVLIAISGQVRRKLEVITEVQFLALEKDKKELIGFLKNLGFLQEQSCSSPYNWRTKTKENEVLVTFTFCKADEFQKTLFITTGSAEHLARQVGDISLRKFAETSHHQEEKEIYSSAELPFFFPELREGLDEFELSESELKNIITTKKLKGILHNHTTYSDGKNTVREMAEYCRDRGFEYLGINDHSKSAYFYANGMYEEQVKVQQKEIDQLNEELAPFRIFKGIEVDILQDGTLDYDNETLASFDFTVASIHSALNMDKIKATDRILKAISHPLTTILGHMTGRLFLRREGYPVDYPTIIEACAANNVIIELNANPRRLDMDWRWIRRAIERGVMISINPDAHLKEGLMDIYYGVCAARKAALPVEMTFNAKSTSEVEAFFKLRQEKALAELK
jgi:DNA polymerase (family 10)